MVLWTGEEFFLAGAANIRNPREEPLLDADLNNATHQAGDGLSHERSTRGYFHVVTELEILDEIQGRINGLNGKCFEDLLKCEHSVWKVPEIQTMLGSGLPAKRVPGTISASKLMGTFVPVTA